MTAQNCYKKSFFKEYLFYKLNALKGNLAVSVILNLMALPLFSVVRLICANQKYGAVVEKTNVIVRLDWLRASEVCAALCAIALVAAAVFGAVLSFDYYNKKERTDTLGSLPLSYKERFWGDFLGGYIVNAAPFVLCAVFSIAVFSAYQNRVNDIAGYTGADKCTGAVSFMFFLALSLFFVYTFAYIISVAVVSACGNLLNCAVFSPIFIISVPLAVLGVCGCFLSGVTGFVYDELLQKILAFFPPLGLLFGELRVIITQKILGSQITDDAAYSAEFTLANPLSVIIFAAMAAAFICAAYYLGKSRRTERVGTAFVHRRVYGALSVTATAAAVACSVYLAAPIERSSLPAIAISASAVVFVLLEIFRRPRAGDIPKSLIRYAATLCAVFAVLALFDKTNALGLYYYCPSADEIASVQVTANFYTDRSDPYFDVTLTDKADIEQLLVRRSDILREYSEKFLTKKHETGSGITEEYKLKNGGTFVRSYTYEFDDHGRCDGLNEMIYSILELPGYAKSQSGFLTDGTQIISCSAVADGIYGTAVVPAEKIPEFSEILSSEIAEKFDAQYDSVGIATFLIGSDFQNKKSVSLLPTYTKTAEFLKQLVSGGSDANARAFSLHILPFTDYSTGRTCRIFFSMDIRENDLENADIKELVSLFKKKTREVEKYDDESDLFIISSGDFSGYYIPAENEKRAWNLVVGLTADRWLD